MKVKDLIALLQTLPQDKTILPQVVGQDSGAWNMHFDVADIKDSWMVVLQLSHPNLKELPKVENF